ncbi:MAG: glutamate racemase [Ruminococcaceae bacterium]|nr:glutamate racemase [Oscillospiraceae bacterium]
MDRRPIGVFDSGLGGLTVVRRLLELMPQEDIVYFGDTGRVPYGTRSEETIRHYTSEDAAFLLGKNVKCIIAACGTVSSVAPDVLSSLSVPAFGVVEPTAAAAAAATKNGRIGIIGTAATVRSGSFARYLRRMDPAFNVTAVACPMFVPLVENGWIGPDDDVAIPMVRRYMQSFKEAQVDTLILGCTHFPLLAPIIQNVLGDVVTLIDSGKETASRCAALLRDQDALSDGNAGHCRFYVSDRPEGFAHVAEIFLGRSVQEAVETVAPDALTLERG